MKRRVHSLKQLGISPECCEPFEEPLCHSDSEELADRTVLKLNLPWRSPVLKSLCEVADRATVQATCPARHDGRLLEVCRRPAQNTSEQAKVPMNLASDCYSDKFFGSLPEPDQKGLTTQPPSGLAEFYFKLTQDHPSLFPIQS
jgi:hypothetical protein